MSEQRLTFEQEAAQVLAEMARLKRENAEATKEQQCVIQELDEQVAFLWDVINKTNAERDAALAALEERAKGLGLRAEQTIRTEHGAIAFKSGYARVTYDAKALDAVIKAPEHGWLRQYRTETFVPPSASVKVEGYL